MGGGGGEVRLSSGMARGGATVSGIPLFGESLGGGEVGREMINRNIKHHSQGKHEKYEKYF